MRYFCTLFDSNYLPHAMSLAESLDREYSDFTLFMFCMDEAAYDRIAAAGLPGVVAIRQRDLESSIPGLQEARGNRSRVEYFYTCSPAICYYSLTCLAGVEEITYLDADLYFFSSPEPIFQELAGKSIGIIGHRYATRRTELESRYGRFNVAWITFRDDAEGRHCLEAWLADCLEWCYQRFEGDKYADQKYLDKWPARYQRLHVIQHLGANVAPWNVGDYAVSIDSNGIKVDDVPLVFYHFAGLTQISRHQFRTGLGAVGVRTSGLLRDQVYYPYARSIAKFSKPNRLFTTKPAVHVKGLKSLARICLGQVRRLRYPDTISLRPADLPD